MIHVGDHKVKSTVPVASWLFIEITASPKHTARSLLKRHFSNTTWFPTPPLRTNFSHYFTQPSQPSTPPLQHSPPAPALMLVTTHFNTGTLTETVSDLTGSQSRRSDSNEFKCVRWKMEMRGSVLQLSE